MVKSTVFQLVLLAFVVVGCKEGTSVIDLPSIKREFAKEEDLLPSVPSKMTFCGEEIYLDDSDLRERLDREILVAKHSVASTSIILKRSRRYFPIIDSILLAHKLPLDLRYVAVAESGLGMVTSPAGAAGIWQLMEGTAKEYGLVINEFVDERFHVIKSTETACKYFLKSMENFEDWPTRVTSYNRGTQGVKNALDDQLTSHIFDTYMNLETSRYVFRILAAKLIMEDPSHYGFHLSDYDYYYPLKYHSVSVNENVGNLKEWAITQGINYKILRTLNPWILKDRLPKKSTFLIDLPIESTNLKPYPKK